MVASPHIQPLPYRRRKYFFLLLFLVFIITLPIVMFYTNGYRFEFTKDATQIVSTGGLFIWVDDLGATVYVDDKLQRDLRIFRQATYIQNLDSGMHQVHVQDNGVQTWVKMLPVYPLIVTEARSFSIPLVPQVRLITEYETARGEAVVITIASTTPVLQNASTTNTFIATTSSRVRQYVLNTEYPFVVELFATTSATSTATLVSRITGQLNNIPTIESVTATSATTSEIATTTKEWRNVRLFESNGEIFAEWLGSESDRPTYYCVNYINASTTAKEFGKHVLRDIESLIGSSTDYIGLKERKRMCRPSIRIDRKWQEVQFFDFFPDSTDLVLMHLTDGLYVVEVDDRGWQNTQLLYRGNDIEVRLDGGQIFIKDGPHYLEVFTEIST